MRYVSLLILIGSLYLVSASSLRAEALSGNASVCIKLDRAGHVVATKITESSGDAAVDDAITQIASQLHWDKPYPLTGWIAIRLGIGAGAKSDRPTVLCDPTS